MPHCLENALCSQNGSLFRYQCSGGDTEGGNVVKSLNTCLKIHLNVDEEEYVRTLGRYFPWLQRLPPALLHLGLPCSSKPPHTGSVANPLLCNIGRHCNCICSIQQS